MCILVGGFSSCKDKNEPIEISFTEYLLTETLCFWQNLNFNNNEIIIINNNEKLESYFYCIDEIYPEIDFSKHTLLLANVCAPGGIATLSKKVFFINQ